MMTLVIDGTMDEFFLLDDSSYWWNQMPYAYELNRFLMVPNAEHTQITGAFLKEKNQILTRIHLRSFVYTFCLLKHQVFCKLSYT